MSAEITDNLGTYLPIVIGLIAIGGVVFAAFNNVAKKARKDAVFRTTTEHNYEKLDGKIDTQKEQTDQRFNNIEDHIAAGQLAAQNSTKEIIGAITKLGENFKK